MLDPALLKNDLETLKLNISRRNLNVDIDFLIKLNEERKKLRFEAEQKRSEQKEIGKEIATADDKSKEGLLSQASNISNEVKSLFEKVDQKDEEFFNNWIGFKFAHCMWTSRAKHSGRGKISKLFMVIGHHLAQELSWSGHGSGTF